MTIPARTATARTRPRSGLRASTYLPILTAILFSALVLLPAPSATARFFKAYGAAAGSVQINKGADGLAPYFRVQDEYVAGNDSVTAKFTTTGLTVGRVQSLDFPDVQNVTVVYNLNRHDPVYTTVQQVGRSVQLNPLLPAQILEGHTFRIPKATDGRYSVNYEIKWTDIAGKELASVVGAPEEASDLICATSYLACNPGQGDVVVRDPATTGLRVIQSVHTGQAGTFRVTGGVERQPVTMIGALRKLDEYDFEGSIYLPRWFATNGLTVGSSPATSNPQTVTARYQLMRHNMQKDSWELLQEVTKSAHFSGTGEATLGSHEFDDIPWYEPGTRYRVSFLVDWVDDLTHATLGEADVYPAFDGIHCGWTWAEPCQPADGYLYMARHQ